MNALARVVLTLVVLVFTHESVRPAGLRAAGPDGLRVPERGLVLPQTPEEGPGRGVTHRLRCTVSGNPTADIDLSCDNGITPDNELAIVVDPEDPNHLLAGSNDYLLTPVGRTIIWGGATSFFVSFDGGMTWTDGQIPRGNSEWSGDPSPAFNAKFDTAHMASLGFVCGFSSCTRGNLTVATSHDGGLNWERPVTVAKGNGSDRAAQQYFHDKEWLTADNHPNSPYYGRLYLTWVEFLTEKGVYNQSPVMFSYSDDAGQNWSKPKVISGRSEEFCEWQGGAQPLADTEVAASKVAVSKVPVEEDPFECDQDQFAYPAVAPDGELYVHFINEQNASAWESPEEYETQIMVVKSTDGGATWSDPVHVVQLEDGWFGVDPDYPINVDGRTTLTGHQFRVNAVGNITVGASGRVFIVFADNAAGRHINDPAFEAVTNTNIYLAYSDDGGATWVGGDSGQTDLASRIIVAGELNEDKDQWFPWADVDPTTGHLKVIYMDGAADRDLYDVEIATWAGVTIGVERISEADSHPDEGLWFYADVAGCETCDTFIGDYNGLAVDSLGRAHGVWTDMRRRNTEVPVLPPLYTQDAYYARQDPTPAVGASTGEVTQPHHLFIPTVTR